MRIVIAALILLAAASADHPTTEVLEGTWEGFIAETPARLTYCRIALEHVDEGWAGRITLPGAANLPLSAIRLDGTDLDFELAVGETRVVFDVQLATKTISGRVTEGDRKFTLDLKKLPVYAEPADRVEAWKQDLEVVRTRFVEYDRSFDPAERAAFDRAIEELETALSDMNDQQVIVALSAAIALSGNAHTRLYLLRNRTELRRLPIRLHWFSDGLFVIRATAATRETLGCRVTAIGGHDPQAVRQRVAKLFAGNASWVDYKSPQFMTSPEILAGLGVIEEMQQVPFRFACNGREPIERNLAPLPLERRKQPTEAWRNLPPLRPAEREIWVSAIPETTETPLYLRNPDDPYWFEQLESHQALYIQYSRSENNSEGPSFADFATEVEGFLGRRPVKTLILDLRFNTGGNNGIAADFMKKLVALEKKKTIGRLYVITGRATFSAGISHAAYLEQNSNATFVGEPIGDDLDMWAEGGNIVLPNSGLTVHFTNGFHSLSAVKRPEYAPYVWADLDLEDLVPDRLVRASSDDYFSGRDPALEAILVGDGTAGDE